MSSFLVTTRIRVMDKLAVETRIQDSINSMMEQSITDAGLMNITRFRIIDFEGLIGAMSIRFVYKLSMQGKDVAYEVK